MNIKAINNVLVLMVLLLGASYLQNHEEKIDEAYSYEVSPIKLDLAQDDVRIKSM